MLAARDIVRAVEAIRSADGLVIGAGAGMGVDSGLPDFRGREGFWRAYPALAEAGIDFTEIANPRAFQSDPRLAWGFYGHRLNLYRRTRPHRGFEILRRIGEGLEHGYLVFTSNVDGHFQTAGFDESRIVECHGSIHHLQCANPCRNRITDASALNVDVDETSCRALGDLPRCAACGGIARPNIPLFGDGSWIASRLEDQQRAASVHRRRMQRPVVIECGAGRAVPTVRMFSEAQRAFLVRINPRDPELDGAEGISLACGALEGLQAIAEALGRVRFLTRPWPTSG